MKAIWLRVRMVLELIGGCLVLVAAAGLGLWRVVTQRKKASDQEKAGEADIERVKQAEKEGNEPGVLEEWRKHRQ